MDAWGVTLNRLKVALINFTIVAALGCLLRYYFFQPFPGFVYPYTLHAHSHLAFLGWVFMALYSLLVYAFLPGEQVSSRKYSWFFIILQVANVGMLLTFPFTGYALWSIIFSSIHAVGSMIFAVLFIRDAKRNLSPEMRMPFAFAKWGLILMFISNFGPFALGPVMARGLGQSDLYYLIIYYYLHFQYNGWFVFAIIGLLTGYLGGKGIATDTPLTRRAFRLKLVAIFPAYVLSALWLEPDALWYWVGGVAGALQLAGVLLLLAFLMKNRQAILSGVPVVARVLLVTGAVAMCAQHVLQFLSAIPALGAEAFASRNIIIAYLHLVLIGFITALLLFFMVAGRYFRASAQAAGSLYFFLGAFLVTECILVFQPQVPQSLLWLLVLAIVQLLAIVGLTTSMHVSKRFIL